MRSEQRAQEYASFVLHSSALTEEHRNAVAHRSYHQRPQVDTPTVLDLPKGYYEARIAMNRRQRGA